MKGLVALLVAASPCLAQFQLLSLDGISELVVPAVQNLGTTGRGEALTARYKLKNYSTSAAPLRLLEVAGTGFSLAAPVQLPQTVPAGGWVEFTVVFRSQADGFYSAALRSEGISVLLTATVVGQLTVAVESAGGVSPLATGAAVNFGPVERGADGSMRFLIQNPTGREEIIPPVVVSGDDFSMTGSPAGRVLKPLDEARFEVRFTPTVSAVRRATLNVGTRSFTLTGVGTEPPLPAPNLMVTLANARSGQQGAIAILLAERSRTAARGTVTLELRPLIAGAADYAAVFSNGLRSAGFTVAPGDDRAYFGDQPSIRFQTGTTAGTLVISMRTGAFSDERLVEIPPASVSLSQVEAARAGTGLEVRVTGFDNTRTAGPLAFTFYDKSGAPIPPGTIRVDGSADFGRFFQASELGGLFQLKAAFPVTGDASGIDSVEVELENSTGTGQARARF
jgi:hypothetical protein